MAHELLTSLLTRPWGQVSLSVYETGRLISLSPWLAGHSRRVQYILDAQRPDGLWGAPGAYAVVPTLSAVEALLTVLRSRAGGGTDDEGNSASKRNEADLGKVSGALDRALPPLLRRLPALNFGMFPDLPASDLIVGSLVGSINRHLDRLGGSSPPFTGRISTDARLGTPKGLDGGRLAKMRTALIAGINLPEKVLHALEVAGDLAGGARTVHPGSSGAIGASPAATAAWLGGRGAFRPRHPARLFLEAVADDHAGPVPCGFPITVFERAWVLSTLARAGVISTAPAALMRNLEAALGPVGTPAAEGLPADADTTSATLYALGLLGVSRSPEALWTYETPTHFCTWPGEGGFSITVNAHVLEAFGQYLHNVLKCGESLPASVPRYAKAVDELVTLLSDQQRADGSWVDRWHASPYYATACCVAALARFGGARAAGVLELARAWVLETQRPDGSWGLWGGTAEETAYALQILLPTPSDTGAPEPTEMYKESITRGDKFLSVLWARSNNGHIEGPALWHDKDLYLPVAIVRASILAAQHLARKYVP
ncbi:prenyltransferase/squalene oxidase repeat-containing protein [Actinomadura sp. KC06]|uniref:prenyltransferase/squalene oxidase repeat-containing protein n=1 Tax=Actinomadura sp. KC06 TaxID=2530369 RepID=UPI001FB72801|nr:prenyltransferase/squalene oxidase repeat-containing protein [Actinomadura sp. KC06]